MRQLYAKYAEDLATASGSTASSINGPTIGSGGVTIYHANSIINGTVETETSDPFYDRFPWFRFIGRGLMFMRNLLEPCSVTQCISIANEKGDVMGYLKVSLHPVMSM